MEFDLTRRLYESEFRVNALSDENASLVEMLIEAKLEVANSKDYILKMKCGPVKNVY